VYTHDINRAVIIGKWRELKLEIEKDLEKILGEKLVWIDVQECCSEDSIEPSYYALV